MVMRHSGGKGDAAGSKQPDKDRWVRAMWIGNATWMVIIMATMMMVMVMTLVMLRMLNAGWGSSECRVLN